MGESLNELLRKSKEAIERMTPEEFAAMIEAQRQSWVRAFGPESACEHGALDWEQCPKCQAKAEGWADGRD